MDGNRRWAKQRNLPSIEGHREGVKSLKRLVSLAPNYGIKYLTVYAFSTENWKREKTELNFLFDLLAEVAFRELMNLKEANVRVRFLGDLTAFSGSRIFDNLTQLETATSLNDGLNLQIALNYGSCDEIYRAIDLFIKESQGLDFLTEEKFSSLLYTTGIPDPNWVLRTGGEKRLSNFLLWQSVNSELVFIEDLWPDFGEKHLQEVINGAN